MSGWESSPTSDALVKKPMPMPARTPARIISMLLDDRLPPTDTLKGPSGPTKGHLAASRDPP